MFKYLTAVMFLLNSGPAWGQTNTPTNPNPFNDAEIEKERRNEERRRETDRLNYCRAQEKEITNAREALNKTCSSVGLGNCDEAVKTCSEEIGKLKRSKKSSTPTMSRMSTLLASQLGVPSSVLSDSLVKNNINKCPQLSGKTYINQKDRIEKKIDELREKINTANGKMNEAMEESTEKQDELDKKVQDEQEKKDEAEEKLAEDKDENRNEQLEKQREAAESLNSMKSSLAKLVEAMKAANRKVSTLDSEYRLKQSEVLNQKEKRSACMMQVNSQLEDLKKAIKGGSATKRTKELEATMQSSYRMCMKRIENQSIKEKEAYFNAVQEQQSIIAKSQEEMKQLEEQIKNSENFDSQAQANLETRNKELESDRDKKVKRADDAINAARTNFANQLKNLSSKVSEEERKIRELQAQLYELEAEKSTLMSIAPDKSTIMVTAEEDVKASSVVAQNEKVRQLEQQFRENNCTRATKDEATSSSTSNTANQ